MHTNGTGHGRAAYQVGSDEILTNAWASPSAALGLANIALALYAPPLDFSVSEKGGGARYAAQWLRDMADPHPSSKPTFDLVVTGSMWSARIVKSYLHQQRALAPGGWPVPLVKVVPPGIDLSIFNTNPAGALGSLGVAATARTSLGEELSLEGRFVVYSAGALGPHMGADILMAAWAEFADRHPQALLLVAWHGAEPYSASQALSACEPRLAALEIHYVDVFTAMKSQPERKCFPRNGEVHFNPEGHRVAAEEIARRLKDWGWLGN